MLSDIVNKLDRVIRTLPDDPGEVINDECDESALLLLCRAVRHLEDAQDLLNRIAATKPVSGSVKDPEVPA